MVRADDEVGRAQVTRFAERSFTVGGHKAPEGCRHGWTDARGRCVLCGAAVETPRGDYVRSVVDAAVDDYRRRGLPSDAVIRVDFGSPEDTK